VALSLFALLIKSITIGGNLIEAYYAPKEEKKKRLFAINILLEKMRYFFRLGFDVGLYSSKKYEYFAQQLNEIGKMVGAWIKSL